MSPGPAAQPSLVRLTVAPEARLLGTVRLIVATAGRRAGLDDELVEDLKVAVSEVCSSVVRDGGAPGVPIEVELAERDDRFVVEIRDRSPSSGNALPEPAGDRDFGLALVGSLVSGLESAKGPAGGHVTRFWLPVHQRGAAGEGA
jgi:serine/threonine-protein kinase RsbW